MKKILLKVPDEILLKQADKLISNLRIKIGEQESYIQELEDKIKILESQLGKNKEWSKEIKSEELYKNLKTRNKYLKKNLDYYREKYYESIKPIEK